MGLFSNLKKKKAKKKQNKHSEIKKAMHEVHAERDLANVEKAIGILEYEKECLLEEIEERRK